MINGNFKAASARFSSRRRAASLTASITLASCAALIAPGAALATSAPRCATAPGGGLTLANVASANGTVRVVGANGLIARARDLTRWRLEPSGVVHNLRGITFTGNRWVAVGDVGTIVYRRDRRWVSVPGLPNSGLRGIAARPGLVAATGSDGVLLTSPDGINWSTADSGFTGLLWGGTRVGSRLVFSGQESTVISSTGGVRWNPVATSPAPTGNPLAPRPLLWQLAAAGHQLVAVGDFGAILTGTLAHGLTADRSPTNEILRGVVHGPRRWVAVGSGGTIVTSVDGRHWMRQRAPVSLDLRGVTWTGRQFVAIGDEGTVISSTDGRRWQVDQSAMPCALLGVAAGAGRLVAVGGAGHIRLARHRGHWSPVPQVTRQDLYAIARGPARFVAVGARATVLTSPNGERWTARSAPATLNLHAVTWTGKGYLAGGDRGLLLASADGTHWRHQPFPGFHSIRGFATDGRSIVAAGAGTVAVRSAAGARWTLESVGLGHFQTGVAYGDGRYVIVGHNGEVLVSTDGGASWQPSVSGVPQNLDAIVWTGRRFVATGDGVAIASATGTQWLPLGIVPRHSIRALAIWGRSVVGVGDLDSHIRLPR
jgi:photosystem II stability/assembly factor-like uncharacterized protein